MKLRAIPILFALCCRGARPRSLPAPPATVHSAADASVVAARAPVDPCDDPWPRTRSLARPAPEVRPEPRCVDDPMCDTVDRAPPGSDACFVSNDHIALAERRIRAAPPGVATAGAPWNAAVPPRGYDRVDAHLHLSAEESSRLRANGFVALDRHGYDSYATAFHAVFQQQLPVYVGVDAILHAIFRGHGAMLRGIESETLAPALQRTLVALRRALAARRAEFPADTVADLDVYLTVASRLLRGDDAAPLDPSRAEIVDALCEEVAQQSLSEVELFGRSRAVDFSQFTPRGHYARDGGPFASGTGIDIEGYFRAMTWLSRLEFNVVSRDCRSSQPGEVPDPAETPREALDALALAELVASSGAAPALARFEQTYAAFGGSREDVSLPRLLDVARAAGVHARDPDAFTRLRAAIGDGFTRTARTHVMPQGVSRLPVIATMFGVRVVPDLEPLTALVHDRVVDRSALGFADVGYLLGHDRARAYLADDLARFPTLAPALDAGRARLRASAAQGDDLYRHWLSAVLALAAPVTGAAPSFMRTDAWRDMRLGSALVGYGQIRHNYVLLAGQGYDAYGCEIPDGYVEPAVEVYDALLAFARRARAMSPAQSGYFARVSAVLSTLRAIAVAERAGRELTAAQRQWLAMVSERIASGGYGGDSGEPPKWTGWYFDLFPDREIGAEQSAAFVADYFTLTNAGEVRYLGADTPRLAVFVVDTNGPPRVMVGPVARGFEASSPIADRLDDERARTAPDKRAPWRASYMVDDDRPPLRVRSIACDGDRALVRYAVEGAPVGSALTVTLLDHHGDALSAACERVVDGVTSSCAFELTDSDAPEQVHVALRIDQGRRYDWVVSARGDEPSEGAE